MISVVGPVYNEGEGIALFHERLSKTLKALGRPYEIIYVNDGSRDNTLEVLRSFRKSDSNVKVIDFSRNFGHQLAITAGMDHASGDACVVIDTDGQDPPELIPNLVAAWEQGNQVVYAVRIKREGETWFKLLTAAIFYRLMRKITTVDIPLDAGDFRLVDRKVLDVLRDLRETHRFVRGLTSWAGYKQTKVEYPRAERAFGETNYPFFKMLRFAIDGITAFSHAPLRWVTLFGLSIFALSLLVGAWVVYVRLFNDRAVQGWASLMVIVLFMGGANLIAMGVIGEYLARIFDEVKRRPLYVVREAAGLEARTDPRPSSGAPGTTPPPSRGAAVRG
jgi:dolichol-phosphate mannosyltransferase